MKKREIRIETKIGILVMAIYNCMYFFVGRTGESSLWFEFLIGATAGCGVGLMILGILPESMYNKLRNAKKKLFCG